MQFFFVKMSDDNELERKSQRTGVPHGYKWIRPKQSYYCEKCGYTTSLRKSMLTHMQRTTPCGYLPVQQTILPKIQKDFTDAVNRYRELEKNAHNLSELRQLIKKIERFMNILLAYENVGLEEKNQYIQSVIELKREIAHLVL